MCIQEDIHMRLFMRAVLDVVVSQSELTTVSFIELLATINLFYYISDTIQKHFGFFVIN